MRHVIVPMAGFLGLAVSGCVSTQSTQSADLPEAENHAAHDAGVGAVQTIYYRPARGSSRLASTWRPEPAWSWSTSPPNNSLPDSASPRAIHTRQRRRAITARTARATTPMPLPGSRTIRIPTATAAGGITRSTVSGYWRYHNHQNPSHTGLIVALAPPGTKLEPLVVEGQELSFPEAPALTRDEYRALLGDTEAVREFMGAYGPHNTLKVLRQAEVETGLDCHQSAHHLGRMTFAEYGAAASISVEEVCRSGMRHGMMEQLFVNRGIANLAEDVEVLCPSEVNSFSRYQCLHGVGHGVMAWTAYEIEDALQLCDLLSDESSQRSCYTGIFMENVVSGLSAEVGQRSAYVDRNDPHYPCNILDERYVDDCYWYQTSQMLVVFNRDLELVAPSLPRGAVCCPQRVFRKLRPRRERNSRQESRHDRPLLRSGAERSVSGRLYRWRRPNALLGRVPAG